jgi:hypothetical protein
MLGCFGNEIARMSVGQFELGIWGIDEFVMVSHIDEKRG